MADSAAMSSNSSRYRLLFIDAIMLLLLLMMLIARRLSPASVYRGQQNNRRGFLYDQSHNSLWLFYI